MHRIFLTISLFIGVFCFTSLHSQKNRLSSPPVDTRWKTHFDTVHAFQVEVPGSLFYNPDLIRNKNLPPGWNVKSYTCTDKVTGIFYLVTISAPGNDQYISNDSLYVVSLRENQAANLSARSLDTILRQNGFFTYLQEGKSSGSNTFLKSMAVVRLNRVITLVAGYEKGKEKNPDILRFMNSFRMSGFGESAFTSQSFGSEAYNAMAPAPFRYFRDTVSAEFPIATFNSRDTFTSDVYSAIIVPATNKQWYRNAGEYWEEKLAMMSDNEDSLISQQPVTNGEAEGYQVVLQSQRLLKHIRMLPFADSLIILVTVTPPEEVLNEKKRGFFESFRFLSPYRKPDIFQSRAQELLSDLLSTDSIIYRNALTRMQDAPFSIADIPSLRKALLAHYPLSEYSTQFTQTPTEKISEALLQLGDPSIASFAMKEYGKPSNRSWIEQSLLLNLIARDPREETFRFIAGQLNAVPRDSVIAEDVLFTLCDDLDELLIIFPDIQFLIDHPSMQNGMLAIMNNLLQIDSISAGQLMPYRKIFTGILEKGLKNPGLENNQVFYNSQYRAMNIAGKLKLQESETLLNWATGLYKGRLRLRAALELISIERPPAQKLLDDLAANKTFRYEMYEVMQEKGWLNKFPGKYARQSLMAESILWAHALEDATPLAIKELAQRNTTIENTPVTVYFFVISFRTDDGKQSPRLAMAVFPEDKENFRVYEDYYTIDWGQPYDSRKKESSIENMMSWLKEE